MEICTPEELQKIRTACMPYYDEPCKEEQVLMYDSDTSDSSTDSSSLPVAGEEPTPVDGVISLTQVQFQQPPREEPAEEICKNALFDNISVIGMDTVYRN